MDHSNRTPTILLIANTPNVYRAFVHAFPPPDWDIQTAASFQEAARILFTRGPIDLVVCDSHLSSGGAIALQNWLRQELILVPFLIFDNSLAKCVGNRDPRRFYLSKPFNHSELQAAVNNAMQYGLLLHSH